MVPFERHDCLHLGHHAVHGNRRDADHAPAFHESTAQSPPTGSLSTTVALALCVFVAVPMFGIEAQGVGGYLRSYIEPTIIMLPFNLISEASRTLALAFVCLAT